MYIVTCLLIAVVSFVLGLAVGYHAVWKEMMENEGYRSIVEMCFKQNPLKQGE